MNIDPLAFIAGEVDLLGILKNHTRAQVRAAQRSITAHAAHLAYQVEPRPDEHDALDIILKGLAYGLPTDSSTLARREAAVRYRNQQLHEDRPGNVIRHDPRL